MNKQNFFSPREISLLNCPACRKVGTLHKSKTRNVWEIISRNLIFWSYYRCWDCDWRGLMFNKKVTKQSFNILLLYVILALCSSFLAWTLLSNITG